MKKIIIALLMSVVCLYINGQTTSKTVTLSFNTSDFSFEVDDGYTYIDSDIHELTFSSDTLLPALPYIGVNVLLPGNSDYTSHSISIQQSTLIGSNVLLPANNIDLISEDELYPNDTIPRNPVYSQQLYPLVNVVFSGIHEMDGYHFASFLICPFSYTPSGGNLYLNQQINLMINYTEVTTRVGIELTGGPNMREVVSSIVSNGDDMDDFYVQPQNRIMAEVESTSISNNSVEYLIITNNALKSTFQLLADWKNMKGIRTKVLTIEEINTNPQYNTQPSNQQKVKAALKDYYNGSYYGLKYVLLGGGNGIVPIQYCYLNDGKSEIPSSCTDIYYACLGTMDWDSNHNNRVGELADNVDLAPELFVTRLPVTSQDEASTIVNRIINYEKYYSPTNYRNQILMSGVKLKKKYWPSGKSDAHYKGDWLFDRYIDNYWNGGMVRFYDTGTSFSGNDNFDVINRNMLQVLTNGYPFFYMATHGKPVYWNMENNTKFYTNEADSVQNPSYTIITAESCYSNQFSGDCLSKTFLFNDDSGIIGFVGGTDNLHGERSRFHIGTGNKMIGHFYLELFKSGGSHYGEAYTRSKSYFINDAMQYNSTRWDLFSLNALGDPEMPVFVNTPQTFNNVSVTYANGYLIVNTGIPESCKICVMSIEDNGLSYYSIRNTVYLNPLRTFTGVNQTCSVCITRPGYIPYVATVEVNDGIAYIQNETFSQSQTINAREVFIGSDVTTSKPQGPVSVENGTLQINYQDKTFIKNNFKVKSGAQLRIQH